MEVGEAVVECMGHGRPLVGWMEMGERLAGRVVLHLTTKTAGVPLVRWQATDLSRQLVHQHPRAHLAGAERPGGIA